MAEESKQPIPPFHQRFNIEVGIEEAQQRFMNRVLNRTPVYIKAVMEAEDSFILWQLADKLGVYFTGKDDYEDYLGDDFYSYLNTLEKTYEVLPKRLKRVFTKQIIHMISESEVDLGIQWRHGAFWPSGAKLLDEALVNENLKWLDDKGYHDVRVPFEKGLRHFLEAIQKPERLGDTVTDVYEAVEALAKRITGRDKDLSANAELFISKLKLSDHYKRMLKDYIEYANEYRHAAELGKRKKPLLRNEVEAFVYTSGLFIRLAVEQIG